jgi:hypothetical protein
MAYRLLREFRQAHTRLDTPPFSNRRHPFSGIALTAGVAIQGGNVPREPSEVSRESVRDWSGTQKPVRHLSRSVARGLPAQIVVKPISQGLRIS